MTTDIKAIITRGEDSQTQIVGLKRLFQSSGKLHADETVFARTDWRDLDMEQFRSFYQRKYRSELEAEADLPALFENLISNNAISA